METPTHLRRHLFALSIMLFLTASIASAEVVANFIGSAECIDCLEKNIKKENAMEGLQVNIKCKVDKEKYETKATGDLDNQGNFKMELPKQLLDKEGKLSQECFAELQSAAKTPCTDTTSPSKIILESKQEEKHTFTPESGKMHFSSATCVSAFFWLHHFHKHFSFHKHYPTPVYKKPPVYTPTPVYSPPVHKPPVYKPPVYTPPVYKPPVYSHPVYKPPVYKAPVPVYKPVYKPPVYKHPIIYKKPCPPISIPTHKPLPHVELPPLHHSHPKYQWPTLPPYSPHPWKKELFAHKHPIWPPTGKHA